MNSANLTRIRQISGCHLDQAGVLELRPQMLQKNMKEGVHQAEAVGRILVGIRSTTGNQIPFTATPGPRRAAAEMDSDLPAVFLELFLTDELLQHIVDQTNLYETLFQVQPGHTKLINHDITLCEVAAPQRMSCRIPERLLDGLRRRSTICWPLNSLSPVVLVPKKDRTLQFCADFRYLNSVSKFDSYPTPLNR
ncbi:hypothetical protein JOB18_010852 [Solea senegalensis]|uniref:Uncharacterized protein n=1 Tax=Solea senegalensis TaxID=28829 RepID=A0AAV6T590_SOLSE|nr:hypothetical protein JOB18_010852 [Solea senegalensis]